MESGPCSIFQTANKRGTLKNHTVGGIMFRPRHGTGNDGDLLSCSQTAYAAMSFGMSMARQGGVEKLLVLSNEHNVIKQMNVRL